jgi:bis(5'-nucleosyl)-tetraphosphatase (symmetrical)
LDTGCVWGGCLSAMRQGEDGQHTRVQVTCAQAQVPGSRQLLNRPA